MQWFLDIFRNPYILAGLTAWAIAQVLKTLIHAIVYKKWDWTRIMGDGGMPSGHSATVTALATMAGFTEGTRSFAFAIALILAIVVCHDAMGVRRETGKQAVILNELMDLINHPERSPEEQLKIFVGHTPLQVLMGILLGISVAVGMYFLIF